MDNSRQNTVYLPSIRPMLVSGTHTVRVRQTVRNKRGTGQDLESFERSQRIIVRTPRFAIDPDSVHACYPPDGHGGRYEGALPYVVLNQATLPWQLSAQADSSANSPPWLALLVFDDQDPPPQSTLVPASELIGRPSTAATSAPLNQKPTTEQSVTIITLPRSQFERLAPTLEDLPWLAHVRRVSVEDKAATRDDTPGKDYAVLVGNRACQIGRRYVVHLVSLNGMGHALPSGVEQDSNAQDIRLVSLLSWAFTCNENDRNFSSLLKSIDPGPIALPVREPQADEPAAIQLVKEAYAKGYCALDHQLRDGANTVSWYRGPFQPLRANPIEIGVSANSADALLRYDPDLGVFDTSYSAAWQLGRQLALSNKEFSSALYRAKIRWYQSIEFNVASPLPAEAENPKPDLAVGPTVARQGSMAASIFGKKLDAARLCSWLHAPSQADTEPDTGADEGIVRSWLSRLLLLYGVPLGYLVADPGMLPEESLRYFRVDRNWLRALLDGALSLGGDDPAREKALRIAWIEEALEEVYKIRQSLIDESTTEDDAESSTDVISGVLLRSRVVSTWPGLEARGFSTAEGKEPLSPLRIEKLTPDLLLCLFDGQVRRVELIEPAESQGFNQPEGAMMRGSVMAVAEEAKRLEKKDAAQFAARLASNNSVVTFRIRDQKA